MSFKRKSKRDTIKVYKGSNDIKDEWELRQIASKGHDKYIDEQNRNRKKNDRKVSILTDDGVQEVLK